MRYTMTDVARRPSRLPDWWLDTPWKRPRNWWTLLFEPGRGWLRWGFGTWSYIEVVDSWLGGPTFDASCAPPLRRLAQPAIGFLRWFARGGGWVWSHYDPWAGEGDEWVRIRFDEWGRIGFREAWVELRDPEWPEGYLLGGAA